MLVITTLEEGDKESTTFWSIHSDTFEVRNGDNGKYMGVAGTEDDARQIISDDIKKIYKNHPHTYNMNYEVFVLEGQEEWRYESWISAKRKRYRKRLHMKGEWARW